MKNLKSIGYPPLKFTILLLTGIMFFTGSIVGSYAQEADTIDHRSVESIFFGIRGGIQNPWILNTNNFKDHEGISYAGTFGYNAGAYLTFVMSNRFFIESGIIYSKQGQNYDLDLAQVDNSCLGTEGTAKLKVELTYLKVPALFRYDFSRRNKVRFAMMAGPQLSFLQKGTDNYNELIKCNVLLPDAEGRYESFDLNIVTGLGLNFAVTDRIRFNSSLLFEFGFFDPYINPDEENYFSLMWRTMDKVQGSNNFNTSLNFGFTYEFFVRADYDYWKEDDE